MNWLKDFLGPYSEIPTLFALIPSPVKLYTISRPSQASTSATQASLKDVYAALINDGRCSESTDSAEERLLAFAREKAVEDPQSLWKNLLVGEKWEDSFSGEYHMGAILCCLKTSNAAIAGTLGDHWKILKVCFFLKHLDILTSYRAAVTNSVLQDLVVIHASATANSPSANVPSSKYKQPGHSDHGLHLLGRSGSMFCKNCGMM